MALGAAEFPLRIPVVVCMPPSKLQRTGLAQDQCLPGSGMGSTIWKELNFMQSYGLGGRSGLVVRTSGLHEIYREAGEGNSNA